MSDEQKANEQVAEQTPTATPAEEQQAPVETQTSESQEFDSSQDQSQSQEANTESESTEHINKPNRAERRINQLVDKLKTREPENSGNNDRTSVVNQIFGNQNQDPFDQIDGELTKEQLANIIDQRARQQSNLQVERLRAEMAYERQVNDFTSDLQETSKLIEQDFADAPHVQETIDQMLTDLNEKANVETYTDQNGRTVRRLVPRVKTSELYKQLKSTLDGVKTLGQSQVTQSMVQTANNSAVTPTNRQTESMSQDDLRKLMIDKPGEVAKMLEEKLGFAD